MRAVVLAAVAAGLLIGGPALAAPKAGEDLEHSEARYSCYGEDAQDEAGSPAAVAEACQSVNAYEAEAKAAGMCWADERASWETCP